MSEAGELTIKQILDSDWVRRMARLSMIALPLIVSGGGSFVGWVIYQNWQTAEKAVVASEKAATIAAAAVTTANEVQTKQEQRADLADQSRADTNKWQDSMDERLVRLNQRVTNEVGGVNAKLDEFKTTVSAEFGELKGDIGELKGLIVRQNASTDGGVAQPFPSGLKLDDYAR